MKPYICESCNYETRDKSNFAKHKSSKKHQEKVKQSLNHTSMVHKSFLNDTLENKFECCFCEGLYSSSSSLARHKKSCTEKVILKEDYENKIKEHNVQIDNLKKDYIHIKQLYDNDTQHYKETIENMNIHYKEIIENLKLDNNRLQANLNNAGNIIKTSVSTANYIVKNYKDAPVLAAPDDYSKLTYNRPKGTKNEDDNDDLFTDTEETNSNGPGNRFIDKDSDKDDEEDELDIDTDNNNNTNTNTNKDKEKFVEKIIYKHKKKILDEYLGRIIVSHYKKKDPAQQSIWNSDTSRLTYIIRELFNNKKIDWMVDKKGIKTTSYIIKPLLKHIDELISEYIDIKTTIDRETAKTEDLIANFDNLKLGNEILKTIETNELSDNILKRISSYFYFMKNDNGLLEE